MILVSLPAASRLLDHPRHVLCGQELNISLIEAPNDQAGIFSMDNMMSSDRELLSCAIEVCDLTPDITEETLSLFFQNRKRSGGDKIEEMYCRGDDRRAVITFNNPTGCDADFSLLHKLNSHYTLKVNSALHPSGVAKSNTSFGWGKGRKVTAAGWQIALCDPIWHVIFCSCVVISITNCYIRTYLLTQTN